MVAPILNKGLVPKGQNLHHGHEQELFTLEKAILMEKMLGDVGSPVSLLKYQDRLQLLDTADRDEVKNAHIMPITAAITTVTTNIPTKPNFIRASPYQ